jgi:hypothetical protein
VAAKALARRLEDAGALGAITSTWTGGWGVTRIFQAQTQKVPTVELSCEDYGLVYRLTERNQGPLLRITAESEALGEVPVFNVIAEIKGSEKPDEYVMLSAHFDSWDGGSGSTDNGTGTITMLEAMRILRAAYPQPKRTIVVGHWNSEENGLVGSRAFAEDHPEIVKGLQALFNQDNGTGRIANVGATGLVRAGAHLADWFSRLRQRLLRVLRSARVRPRLRGRRLRHLYMAHRPGHLRQGHRRQLATERHPHRHAGVLGVRGSRHHAPRPADHAGGPERQPGGVAVVSQAAAHVGRIDPLTGRRRGGKRTASLLPSSTAFSKCPFVGRQNPGNGHYRIPLIFVSHYGSMT